MKINWFTRKGIFYKPISITGWVIFAMAIAGAVYMFIDINSHSHSVSDLMISFVFNVLLIGLIYTIIAYFTEDRRMD